MIAAEIGLGARLATTVTADGRRRTMLTALAALAGTAVFLAVSGAARADRALHPERYLDPGMDRLLAIVVVVIGLQVAALAATAGRLSASVRARRLTNLRLLGLSSSRVRVVAGVETALGAVAGALAGVGVFELVRPLLARVSIAGTDWSTADLDPGWRSRGLTVLAVVALTVVMAMLPERAGAGRRTSARRPSPWRVLPLLAGAAGCCWFLRGGWNRDAVPLMLASVVVLGVGVIAVLPVFVRLVADALVRVGRGGVTTIAGRRLQAQPASITRVVTGLLLGLFIVTGARLVVVAFESTPQYIGAARQVEDRQMVTWTAPTAAGGEIVARLGSLDAVSDVVVMPLLAPVDQATDGLMIDGVVATCEQLAVLAPSARGCVPDEVQMFGNAEFAPQLPVRLAPTNREYRAAAVEPMVIDEITGRIEIDEGDWSGLFVLVPPSMVPAGWGDVPDARAMAVAAGPPGAPLADVVHGAGFPDASAPWGRDDYDMVATLRAIVLAVSATVLAVGLLAFAVAAIDRAMQRRREAVALQLVGVPGSVLRRVQWIESVVPIVGGSVLAIGSGVLAGAAYLAGASTDAVLPWPMLGSLALAATVGGFAVAALTVVAANPRIAPDTIRRD